MGDNVQEAYRYTECGLADVYIHGLEPFTDDAGERVFRIINVNGLHRVIAASIVVQDAAMDGKQVRFLRTEMGLTQAELGKVIHKEALTIGRWERGESPVDDNAETIIRLVAIERLELEIKLSVEDISGLSIPTASIKKIDIDGKDPKNYVPLPAAA